MIDLNKYSEFVREITSDASQHYDDFLESIEQLQKTKFNTDGDQVNVPLLFTGAMGMCGESGEFSEIVKKLIFHRKNLTPEVHEHLVKELGDVIWYWINTCRALGVDPNEVIALNIEKLQTRYPGGVFSAEASQTRAINDI